MQAQPTTFLFARVFRIIALVIVCTLAYGSPPVGAHPHSFVEATVAVVFNEKGLAGFRQRWVLDEMTTVSVLDVIGENGDGVLDPEERQAVKDISFKSIRDFNYFTSIMIQDSPFEVQWATDFTSSLQDGKLVYSFLVPCHVTAGLTEKKVLVAVFDPSFYTYVTYVGADGGGSIDPTKDPLFRDPAAQARPGDFERFSEAVGLSAYKGGVQMLGPADAFHLKASVVDAPSMAYFHGQIIPQAFSIRFSTR